MHDLGRGPHGQRIGAAVVFRDNAAGFHRHGRVTVMNEAPAQTVRAGVHRRGAVALFRVQKRGDIASEMFVDQACAVGQRCFRFCQRRQGDEFRFDQFERVFGDITAVGDRQRECFAHVADFILGDQRLVRDQNVGVDPVAPALRRHDLHAVDRR